LNLKRTLLLILIMLIAAVPAVAKEDGKAPAQKQAKAQGKAQGKAKGKEQDGEKAKDEAKELSGISIVGNKEAPKSLFIVPWKSSELGVETGLASSLLNEDLKPVDKEVFERELDFYSITAVE